MSEEEKTSEEQENRLTEERPTGMNPTVAQRRDAHQGPAKVKSNAQNKASNKEEAPPQPSPYQPFLDELVEHIRRSFGEGVVKEASINRYSRDLPTLVIDKAHWLSVAKFLKEEPTLQFNYLNDIAGVDYRDAMQVVYQLVSIPHHRAITVKVKTARDSASVPSVVSVWTGANWQEREQYDLLGIHFTGHPDLRRIMMPEGWVGHPLRKDYEPYDLEV